MQPSIAPSIAIIDYKAGNLRSVQKALEECGATAHITADAEDISAADGVVFPGQGACDASMLSIRERGLFEIIRHSIDSGKPFLGVCLGLQLLLESSEEGEEPCLAILKGSTKRLPPEKTEQVGLKIPHMGWNSVSLSVQHPVFEGIPNDSYFYFVHSYYADPEDKDIVAGVTNYGIDFCSAVAWDNVAAVQFHPEKSGAVGLRLYRNFLTLVDANRKAAAWR
jgi:glutamine amidotransferase